MRKRNKNSIVLLICGPRRQVELKDPRWLEVVFHSLSSVFSWPPISIPSHSGQEPSQCAKLRGGPSQAVPQAQCDKETGSLLSMSSVHFLERFTTRNEEKHSWSDSRWPVHCSHQERTWLPLRMEGSGLGTGHHLGVPAPASCRWPHSMKGHHRCRDHPYSPEEGAGVPRSVSGLWDIPSLVQSLEDPIAGLSIAGELKPCLNWRLQCVGCLCDGRSPTDLQVP